MIKNKSVSIQSQIMNNINNCNDYHIISPVFNEEDNLGFILEKAQEMGYLHKITFVNDASTDNTLEILKKWNKKTGLGFINLKCNRKKEGAILFALELMEKNNDLPDKIITLDSDTFLQSRDDSESIDIAIQKASSYMDQMNLTGMTFNMEPILCQDSKFLEKLQYPEYTGLWFWHRQSAKQNKIWVLNGPGVIFRSRDLLDALRNMTPDFETGDFLITVNLMNNGHKIGYYEKIKMLTSVPSSPYDLFKQRRRWERGTLKVLSWNIPFFVNQFFKLNLISVQLFLYLWIYLGVVLLFINWNLGKTNLLENILFLGFFWLFFNFIINLSNRSVWRFANIRRILIYTPIWLFIWPLIVMPARIAGFLDFIKHYLLRVVTKKKIAIYSDLE